MRNVVLISFLSVALSSCLLSQDNSELSGSGSSNDRLKNSVLDTSKLKLLSQAKFCVSTFKRGVSGMAPVGTATYYQTNCDNGLRFYTDKKSEAVLKTPGGARVPILNATDKRADEVRAKLVDFMDAKGFKIADEVKSHRWMVFLPKQDSIPKFAYIYSKRISVTKMSFRSISSYDKLSANVSEASISTYNTFVASQDLEPIFTFTKSHLNYNVNKSNKDQPSGFKLYRVKQ